MIQLCDADILNPHPLSKGAHSVELACLGINLISPAARGFASNRPAKNSFMITSISFDTSSMYSTSPQVSQIRAGTSLMTMISSPTLAMKSCLTSRILLAKQQQSWTSELICTSLFSNLTKLLHQANRR